MRGSRWAGRATDSQHMWFMLNRAAKASEGVGMGPAGEPERGGSQGAEGWEESAEGGGGQAEPSWGSRKGGLTLLLRHVTASC